MTLHKLELLEEREIIEEELAKRGFTPTAALAAVELWCDGPRTADSADREEICALVNAYERTTRMSDID